MQRFPWIKWYPADWRQEITLRLCSRNARSLWLDLIGLMHEAEPYGHLLFNGRAPSPQQLAAMLGDTPKQIAAWLKELEQAGVCSRNADGIVFCRRMVADRQRSERGAESAQRRWGKDDDPLDGSSGGSPNGSANAKPDGKPTREPTAQKPEARCQRPEATRQTPESRIKDSDSECKKMEGGEDAGSWGGASGSIALPPVVPGQALAPRSLKDPSRADADLARHMAEHGGMTQEEAWLLVMAARDPADARFAQASDQCGRYSRRFRLGWFADERAAPALPIAGLPRPGARPGSRRRSALQ